MSNRLLFAARYDLEHGFSLRLKFDSQCCALERLGYQVDRVCYDRSGHYLCRGDEKIFLHKARTSLPMYEHFFFYIEFGKAIRKAAKLNRYGTAYVRETPGFLSLHRAWKALCRGGTHVIYEIPTFHADGTTGEKQHGLRALFQKYGSLWLKKDAPYISLYPLIGDENPQPTFRGRPCVNIRNGIDIDSLPLRSPANDSVVHLLALGSMGPWHGFDRAIRASAAYHGDVPFVLHLVGGNDGGSLTEWQQLAQSLGAGERIVFEGPLYGEQLNQMFDRCDVGISSLAPFRSGAERLYSLKLREYMARGLPVIYAADDPALETTGYVVSVPNDDSVPDMSEWLAFALRCKAQPDFPQQIRSFAKAHFTWESQLEQVMLALPQTNKE